MKHSAHYMLSITARGIQVHRLNAAVEQGREFMPDRNWSPIGEQVSHLGDAMQVVQDCEAGEHGDSNQSQTILRRVEQYLRETNIEPLGAG